MRTQALVACAVAVLLGPTGLTAQDAVQSDNHSNPSKGRVPANLLTVAQHVRLDEARNRFRVTGRGIGVAVVGNGVFAGHQDFAAPQNLPRRVDGRSFVPDKDWREDRFGTTTHDAGLIAANGVNQGVAYQSTVVSLKVLGEKGQGGFEEVVRALDWVLENRDQVSVVHLGVGTDTPLQNLAGLTPVQKTVAERIRQLRQARIAVVAPAGNSHGPTAEFGLSFPAIVPEVLSVGAVYSRDRDNTKQGEGPYSRGATAGRQHVDAQAPYSNRLAWSPETGLGLDLLAPGGPVSSTCTSNPGAQSLREGTTTAAAIVSGAVALLQEYHKRRTGRLAEVDDVERWLRDGAVEVRDRKTDDDNVPHTGTVFRRLDVLGALFQLNAYLDRDAAEGSKTAEPTPVGESVPADRLLALKDAVSLPRALRTFRVRDPDGEPRALDGRGLFVAVVSTGVDAERVRGVVRRIGADPAEGRPEPEGVGTHMAGMLLGFGSTSGVSPGATLLSVTPDGVANEAVLQALETVLRERDKRIGVVVLALPPDPTVFTSAKEAVARIGPTAERVQAAVTALQERGTVVFASAGEGDGAAPGMTFPAILPSVVSVGSSELSENGVHRLAKYSLRLPGDTGTDIFAPGGPVVSAGAEQDAVLHGAPVSLALAAGTTLLVQDFHLTAQGSLPTVEQVRRWLRTRHRGGWIADGDHEYPRLDVYATLEACARSLVQAAPKK